MQETVKNTEMRQFEELIKEMNDLRENGLIVNINGFQKKNLFSVFINPRG